MHGNVEEYRRALICALDLVAVVGRVQVREGSSEDSGVVIREVDQVFLAFLYIMSVKIVSQIQHAPGTCLEAAITDFGKEV